MQACFIEEYIVGTGRDYAYYYDDNTKQIYSMPELFYVMRVGLHQVVKCAEDQTGLRTPEVDSKYSIVHIRDIKKSRLSQIPQGGSCDES